MPNILYSFRRCPYAIRARMALKVGGVSYEHREIEFKNKPSAMLAVSPKGTVPVLILNDGRVLEESLDIMHFALGQCENKAMNELIHENDNFFKSRLDYYKYPSRPTTLTMTSEQARDEALMFLAKLETLLTNNPYLYGEERSFADLAILPFIRQFSRVDSSWFEQLKLPKVQAWLQSFLASELFLAVMQKIPLWNEQS